MVQPELSSLANPFPACAIVTGLSEGFGSWKASVLWQRSAGIGITLILVETWRLKHELKHTTWYLVVPSATFNSCIAGDVLLQQRCQVFSSSQQAMLPSGPHSGWQHIFLGCEDSTFVVASGKWWSPRFLRRIVWSFTEVDWKTLRLCGSPATMWLFGHLTSHHTWSSSLLQLGTIALALSPFKENNTVLPSRSVNQHPKNRLVEDFPQHVFFWCP